VLLRLYALLSVALSPVILAWVYLNPKLSPDVRSRLAADLGGRTMPDGQPRIWIHAVSVGEALAAAPVVVELRKRYPDALILFTVTTATGYETALRTLGAASPEVRFFPLDFPWVIARVIRFYRPHVFVCTEADVWPNLLMDLNRRRVPTLVFNARLVERASGRKRNRSAFRVTRRFVSESYRLFDAILAQSERDKERFVRMGIDANRVEVVGSTKFDMAMEPMSTEKRNAFKAKWGWLDRRVIFAASTHDGEEEIILQAFLTLRKDIPDLALVLAPRHTDRAKSVAALVGETSLWFQRYSTFTDIQRSQSVLIIDTMGVLGAFYQIADCVVVGGTFSEKVGGHNLLEPAQFSRPIVVGPYVHTIDAQVKRLLADGGVLQLSDASAESLAAAFHRLLSSSSDALALGVTAFEFYQANQGVTTVVADRIATLLKEKR